MPGPLGPAAVLAGPGAVAAAKHLAVHAGPGAVEAARQLAVRAATSPGVTSAGLTAVMFYWAFGKLPDWVKNDISFKNLMKNRDDLSQEEFEGLFSVIDKLQNIASNIQDLDTDIPQLYAALLAFIQLSGQYKLQQLEQIDYNRSVRDQKGIEDRLEDSSDCSSFDSSTAGNHGTPQSTIGMRDYVYESAGTSLYLSQLRSNEIKNALKMATFAYYEDSKTLTEKLDEIDYKLLHHKLTEIRPGRSAYYIAVSPIQRQVFVGIRGTSTLGDLLTDCCGSAAPLVDDNSLGDKVRVEIKAAVPHIIMAGSQEDNMEVISGHERILLEDHDDDGDNFIRCHEGILISARNVMGEIETLLLPLIESDHKVFFCGHSLGAGTAVLATTILRSKYPELFLTSGRVHAYAFGAPPVLDHDSAIAARSYCTSIIHNADLISRLNITNLAVSLACLRKIQHKLNEKKMCPTGPVTSVTFLNKIAEGISGTPLMSHSELDETINEAHDNLALRKPEHLFVPGRVLLVYHPWVDESGFQEDDSNPSVRKKLKCVETSGTSPVFQRIEIDGLRCFTDHLASSYFAILGMNYDF